MNRFLEIAGQYGNVSHQWASEKLDGWQGCWDGGRLMSKSGKTLNAPDWWLERLPSVPLQGELFTARSDRDFLSSVIGKQRPGAGWRSVTFRIFDSPNDFYRPFRDTYAELKTFENEIVQRIPQIEIQGHDGAQFLASMIGDIKAQRGEGVVVRNPDAVYSEAWDMLKYKPLDDAEGQVIGCISGAGRLAGMLGSLILKLKDGVRLAVGGFRNGERLLNDAKWAAENPRKECPQWVESISFPTGSVVTFQHEGISGAGVPRMARYFRRFAY